MAEGIGALPDLQTIARLLGGVVNDGQVLAPGPDHSRADKSLSVKVTPNGFVVNSFAGDDPIVCRDYVREKLGLPAFKSNGRQRVSDDEITQAVMAAAMRQGRSNSKGKIVAIYDYTDAGGALLYQVLRYEPKDFRQRRPDGNGKWIWKLDDQRVVYRWPELLKYPDASIFITEGEKDADRVAELNLCATTVATGKWTDDCIKALAGRNVVILQDNDDSGRKKAIEAATALHGTVNNIRIVSLPCRIGATLATDWMLIEPAPKSLLMFVLTRRCGIRRTPKLKHQPLRQTRPKNSRSLSSTFRRGGISRCRNANGR